MKKFSAVFEIGGTVGSSMKQVGSIVRGDLSGIGDAIRDIKKQQDKLEKYDPSAVREAGREYRNLKREAGKLFKEYAKAEKPTQAMKREMLAARRAADKAGKAYKAQREALDKLGGELKDAGVDTNNLAAAQKRLAKQADKARKKMEAAKRFKSVGNAMGEVTRQAGGLALGIGGAAAGLGAALTMTNKLTADQESLARSLGMSSKEFDAWGGLAREAGFEADTVGDLIEEMNNKLGESAGLEETTPVKESLEMLGLAFEDLQNLAPEEQFRTIAKAIKELDDQQQAVSAADILMGGDANKFFGYLRSREEGVDEMLDQQRRLNLLSDEGRAGAHKFNVAMGQMKTLFGSLAQEVAGLVGGELAPFAKQIAPKIAAWMKEHRKDFKAFAQGIGDALPKVGAFISGMWAFGSAIGSAVGGLADFVGGMDNLVYIVGGLGLGRLVGSVVSLGTSLFSVGKALAPLVSGVLPSLAMGIKAVGAAVMANPIGLVIGGAVLAVYRLITAWDDLKKAFKVGGVWGAIKTYFGAGDSNEAEASSSSASTPAPIPKAPQLPTLNAGNSTTHVRQEVGGIQIHAAPGQSAEEIAEEVARRLDRSEAAAARGMLYDGA